MRNKRIATHLENHQLIPMVFEKPNTHKITTEKEPACLNTIRSQALALSDLLHLSDTDLVARTQREFDFLSAHTWEFSNRPQVKIADDFLDIYQSHGGCLDTDQLFGDSNDHRWKAPIDQPFVQQLLHKKLPFLDGTSIRVTIGKKNIHFIASQAPLPQQFNPFWKKLIWDQDADLILHLSAIREESRLKSDNYWQEGHYPPIDVLNIVSEKHSHQTLDTGELTSQKFLINTFQISHNDTGEKRRIRHIQTPDWKDGMSFSPEQLIHLKALADTHCPDKPIIIHCSAGVGRTGQAISYFILQNHIQEQSQSGKSMANTLINPLETVYQLRCHRPGMILNASQYLGIYKALKANLVKSLA